MALAVKVGVCASTRMLGKLVVGKVAIAVLPLASTTVFDMVPLMVKPFVSWLPFIKLCVKVKVELPFPPLKVIFLVPVFATL